MVEQHEPNTNDAMDWLDSLPGPEAYKLISRAFGLPLTWDTFVRTLVDEHGRSNRDACLLLEWCLDWYRPHETGKRYRGDAPYLDSAGLAADWGMSTDRMKRVRRALSKSGLVKFETRQHICLVRVRWSAVCYAVGREADFRGCKSAQSEESRGCKSAQSEASRGCKSAQSERPEGANLHTTLPLRSSFNSSSLSEEEGETLEAMFVEMITHGRKAGRSCDAQWLQESRDAFFGVVADGRDPNLVKAAWYEYVDEKGKGATYLGHWLKGLNLRGEKADKDEWAFVACYERLEHAAELRAERERVAAGGVPKPKLEHTSVGWVELVSGLVLEGVDEGATVEEAEEAWPEVWRQAQAS